MKHRHKIQTAATIALSACLFLSSCGQTTPVADAPAPTTNAPAPASTPPAVTPPPAPPAELTVTLPAGTALKIRTNNALSTKDAAAGDAFTGSLSQALKVDGKVIAPVGATVKGVVVNSGEGGRVKGLASISVRLTHLNIAGNSLVIKTSPITRDAPATKKKDGVKVGIGAGIGAAIGAIAGGGKGAAIGAASGAGAGTAVVLATHGEPARIPAESQLTFKLAAPLTATLPPQ